jgi:hypothetical protein
MKRTNISEEHTAPIFKTRVMKIKAICSPEIQVPTSPAPPKNEGIPSEGWLQNHWTNYTVERVT